MSKLLKLLSNEKVFLDSSCFIYLFENIPKYANLLEPIFNESSSKKIRMITSNISVSETLVKPFQDKNSSLVESYIKLFEYLENLTISDIDFSSSIEAARLRAAYKFKLLDSYQLSLAIGEKCKHFLTNDKQLKNCKEIKVLILKDFI